MQNNISIKEIFKEAIQILKTNKSYLSKVYTVAGLIILPFIIFQFVGMFIALQPVFNIYKITDAVNVGESLPDSIPDPATIIPSVGIGIMFTLLTIIIMSIVNLGILRIQISLVDGVKLPVSTVIKSYKFIWRAGISGFTALLFVILGLILLIIPGIYIGYRLMFVGIAAVDPKLTIPTGKIVKYVWDLTNGRFGLIAKFIIVSFLLTIITSLLVRLPVILISSFAGNDSIILISVINLISTVLDALVSIVVGLVTSFATVILYRRLQAESAVAPVEAAPAQSKPPTSAPQGEPVIAHLASQVPETTEKN